MRRQEVQDLTALQESQEKVQQVQQGVTHRRMKRQQLMTVKVQKKVILLTTNLQMNFEVFAMTTLIENKSIDRVSLTFSPV